GRDVRLCGTVWNEVPNCSDYSANSCFWLKNARPHHVYTESSDSPKEGLEPPFGPRESQAIKEQVRFGGHSISLSDLYAMRFPSPRNDVEGVNNEENFRLHHSW